MLNLSQAQLIGTISRSFEDLEVITAVITNAGSRHVSVLKHSRSRLRTLLETVCRWVEAAFTTVA